MYQQRKPPLQRGFLLSCCYRVFLLVLGTDLVLDNRRTEAYPRLVGILELIGLIASVLGILDFGYRLVSYLFKKSLLIRITFLKKSFSRILEEFGISLFKKVTNTGYAVQGTL